MSSYDVTLGMMRRLLVDAGATDESATAAALTLRGGGTVQAAGELIELRREPEPVDKPAAS